MVPTAQSLPKHPANILRHDDIRSLVRVALHDGCALILALTVTMVLVARDQHVSVSTHAFIATQSRVRQAPPTESRSNHTNQTSGQERHGRGLWDGRNRKRPNFQTRGELKNVMHAWVKISKSKAYDTVNAA